MREDRILLAILLLCKLHFICSFIFLRKPSAHSEIYQNNNTLINNSNNLSSVFFHAFLEKNWTFISWLVQIYHVNLFGRSAYLMHVVSLVCLQYMLISSYCETCFIEFQIDMEENETRMWPNLRESQVVDSSVVMTYLFDQWGNFYRLISDLLTLNYGEHH